MSEQLWTMIVGAILSLAVGWLLWKERDREARIRSLEMTVSKIISLREMKEAMNEVMTAFELRLVNSGRLPPCTQGSGNDHNSQ